MRLEFQKPMWKGYVILAVFYKPGTGGTMLSWYRYVCPMGHDCEARTNAALRGRQCHNLICVVRKVLKRLFKIKTHIWPDGSSTLYMGYEHHLLNLLSRKFEITTIKTSLDIISEQDWCRLFTYTVAGRFLIMKFVFILLTCSLIDIGKIRCYLADVVVEAVINRNVYYRWYNVKSHFTFNKCGKDRILEKINLTKWKWAAITEGRQFDAFIFDDHGDILIIFRCFPDGSIRTYATFNDSEADESETGDICFEAFILPEFLLHRTRFAVDVVQSFSDLVNVISQEIEENYSNDSYEGIDEIEDWSELADACLGNASRK